MKNQETTDYTFSFESSHTPSSVFEMLLDVSQWWTGLYGEEIKGKSKNLHDEFTFRAGEGLHYTRQRLIELVTDQKMVWLVTESNLSFITKTDEWINTQFGFEISTHKQKTRVTFTHQGLIPKIECYQNCSMAWTAYMGNLATRLK